MQYKMLYAGILLINIRINVKSNIIVRTSKTNQRQFNKRLKTTKISNITKLFKIKIKDVRK